MQWNTIHSHSFNVMTLKWTIYNGKFQMKITKSEMNTRFRANKWTFVLEFMPLSPGGYNQPIEWICFILNLRNVSLFSPSIARFLRIRFFNWANWLLFSIALTGEKPFRFSFNLISKIHDRFVRSWVYLFSSFEDLFQLVGGGIIEWIEKKIHHDTSRAFYVSNQSHGSFFRYESKSIEFQWIEWNRWRRNLFTVEKFRFIELGTRSS